MGRPHGVRKLPPGIRQWLNNRLMLNGFTGYVELSAELAEKGFAVSKSAVHRWGNFLKGKVDEAEANRLINIKPKAKTRKTA